CLRHVRSPVISDRSVLASLCKGFCNAGEAVLVAWLLERWFDPAREDFTSQWMLISPGFAAIYSIPEETVEISVGDWRSRVHPDDLPQFLAHRQQVFAEQHGERRMGR